MENMVIDKRFWKDKRVVITGHTGFKGAWLTNILKSWGAHICGISLPPPTTPHLFGSLDLEKQIEHYIVDIRNYSQLNKTIKKYNPEILFHLAAQPLVRYSYEAPLETYETNVMGTANILESLRSVSTIKSIVIVTTDKCYENQEWVYGYREIDPMGGYDPYSSSKGCAELVVSAYRKSFYKDKSSIGIASARAGNVIGGGDWANDRLVPDLIKGLVHRQVVEIRNPHSIRPWQHVLEPLSGYIVLAQKLYQEPQKYAEAFNFGPEIADCIPVGDIVKSTCEQWGNPKGWRLSEGSHPHEAHFLKLDISKARNILDWSPRWSIQKALQNTVQWYKMYYSNEKENIEKLTMSQIEGYFKQ